MADCGHIPIKPQPYMTLMALSSQFDLLLALGEALFLFFRVLVVAMRTADSFLIVFRCLVCGA